MTNKVLIIAHEMIPFVINPGGTMRMLKLCKYLKSAGFSVYLVSSIMPGVEENWYGMEDNLLGISVFRIPYPFLAKLLMSWRTTRILRKTHIEKTKKNYVNSKSENFIVKKVIKSAKDSWNRRALKKVSELIDSEEIDHIIISIPAYHTSALVKGLREKFGKIVNIIVDYRDSWNTRGDRINADSSEIDAERDMLSAADHVTCASDLLLERLKRRFNIKKSPSLTVVENGYDLDDFSCLLEKKNDPCSDLFCIRYFGNLTVGNGIRDPISFLKGFVKFRERKSDEDREKIRFELFGTVLNSLVLSRFPGVFFLGNVDHSKAVELMRTSTLLITLHSDRNIDEAITSKYYEYLASRRPIIACTPSNTAVRFLVEKNHVGIWLDIEDVDVIEEKLDFLFRLWKNCKLDNLFAATDEFIFSRSRQKQYEKFLELMGGRCNET